MKIYSLRTKKGFQSLNLILGLVVILEFVILKTACLLIREYKEKGVKYEYYYKLVSRWLSITQKGGSLEKEVKKRGYKLIAIYGKGYMGQCLYEALENSDCNVVYVTDQNQNKSSGKYLSIYEELPYTDVMIVTAVNEFTVIKNRMEQKVKCPIISLDELLYGYEV